jgi:hypothetical protein
MLLMQCLDLFKNQTPPETRDDNRSSQSAAVWTDPALSRNSAHRRKVDIPELVLRAYAVGLKEGCSSAAAVMRRPSRPR